MTRTPWIGLAALVAMFVIPFLPDWLFEGPRRVKHWPRRHVCGQCDGPWTSDHICAEDATEFAPPLRGELRRLRRGTVLEHWRPPRTPSSSANGLEPGPVGSRLTSRTS
jgi:hypothetical protein